MNQSNQTLEELPKVNPSYDKTKPFPYRLNDFLGKYHIQLNGTTPHEPFYFDEVEDAKVGRCDGEYKEAIIDFVMKECWNQAISACVKAMGEEKKHDRPYEAWTIPEHGWNECREESLEKMEKLKV